MDKMSPFLRQIILPPDPPAVNQPREEPYAIDEQGGYAVPLFFVMPGAVVTITPPSWATGFLAACTGSGAAGSVFNGSYPNMGGGGGAWSKTNSVTLSGALVSIYVGLGGTAGGDGEDTWISTTGVAPLSTATGCLAKGGTALSFPAPLFDPLEGIGGQASACIGNEAYSGGNGGLAAVSGGVNFGGTGGGGAGGPAGNGLNAAGTTAQIDGTSGGDANGAHGAGTGGLFGRGTTDTVINAPDSTGQPGGTDPIFAMAGGPGGGGGAGGGGAFLSYGGNGGAGGSYGGGGGGGGYGNITNGLGGPGGHGFVMLRWLQ